MEEKVTKVPADTIPAWAVELMEANKKLAADNAMFREMMGDNKIKSWEARKQDFSNKFCHFKSLDGRVIVGWSDLDMKGYIAKAQDARSENIKLTVTFRDGKSETINYYDFVTCKEIVNAEIVSFGQNLTEVKFEDGEVATIPTKFLNA